jgi:Domain of unknown function (DUF4382)
MALTLTQNSRARYSHVSKFLLLAVSVFGISLTGCNNTCFIFTSNPPTGTINIKAGDAKPACTLTTANGTVRVLTHTVSTCNSCSTSSRIAHIFVSLRGIEVHPSAIADEDSPDWQELMAPKFVAQPLQVDLKSGTADQGAGKPLGEMTEVPAGIYRQVRLRFEANQPATGDQLLEKNACGSAGFNCVVMADGHILPLLLDGDSPELRITSDRITSASLLIPPDTDTDLVIELKPVWAWFSSADEGVRLLPALTGNAKVERVEFDGLELPTTGKVVEP